MGAERHVKLFRHGQHQAVRIPVEFELPGDKAIMLREGNRLVIEPVKTSNLLEWLATIEPWDEEFPDVDERSPLPRESGLTDMFDQNIVSNATCNPRRLQEAAS